MCESKSTLKNHIVKYNEKLYIQLQGAAIGVIVAGDVAELFNRLSWNWFAPAAGWIGFAISL